MARDRFPAFIDCAPALLDRLQTLTDRLLAVLIGEVDRGGTNAILQPFRTEQSGGIKSFYNRSKSFGNWVLVGNIFSFVISQV